MSSDPFNTLISGALVFLAQLSENNTRDWFQSHKSQYDAQIKRPASLFAEQIAARVTKDTGHRVTAKLYRIHRDLRFSKDKTPYHTHLHMHWRAPTPAPYAWMFGVHRDYVCVGFGVMGFDKAQLSTWRDAMATRSGKELQAALLQFEAKGCRYDQPELKRVPAPFAKDHPQGALLRRKGLLLWQDLPKSGYLAPETAVMDAIATLDPLRAHLDKIFAS